MHIKHLELRMAHAKVNIGVDSPKYYAKLLHYFF